MADRFYAVRVGRDTGIFTDWYDCRDQIQGFPRAEFKKFSTREEAQKFLDRRPRRSSRSPSQSVSPKGRSAQLRGQILQATRREREIYIISQRLATLGVGDTMSITRASEGFNFDITKETTSEGSESGPSQESDHDNIF